MRKNLLAWLAAGTALTSAPAMAQTTPGTGVTELSDIVVTANRREERLQDVPIAVQAITAETTRQRGVVDLQTLRTAIPSLTFDRQTNAATPFLRGVGTQTGSLSNEPSIALYVDNVYIGTGMGSLFDFNNISRIEVLKGPQGTLFGRNAVGGVIHVLTRDPTHEPSMDVDMGIANYKTWSANLYATGSISETLAANVALHATKRGEGWGRNLNTGNDTYRMSDYAARVKLLWMPADDTRVLLSGDVDQYKGDEGITRTMIPGTTSNPGTGAPAVGNPGFYNALNSVDAFNNVHIAGASLQVDQGLGPVNLTSVTAYRSLHSKNALDSDALPRVTQQVFIRNRLHTFTQELQLKSATESRLSWILGGYFFRSSAAYAPLHIFSGGGGTLTRIDSKGNTESLAGFGQATYEVTPKLGITLGARYTSDTRDIKGSTRTGTGVTLASRADTETKWKKFTWRVSADYHFTDDVMVYASANRGFKSGVYDLSSYTGTAVNPEVLDAYEVGIKSELMDRRLRLNAAAFYYDYSNIQVTQIVLGTSRTLNGGAATIKGIDLDFTAIPVENLTLSGGVAIIDGQYDEFAAGPHFNPTGSPGATTSCAIAPFLPGYPGGQTSVAAGCDLSGNDTISTPKFTASLAVNYVQPLARGSLSYNVNYYYNDGYFFEPDNSVRQDAYGLLGASITWAAPDDRYSVRVWGANLTDEKYYSAANSAALGKHYSAAAPRTYGVTLAAHF